MDDSLEVFESMINHEWFQKTPWILFLNKKDIFKNKIKTNELIKTFPKYIGGTDYQTGLDFIKDRYMRRVKTRKPTDVYVHFTCAIDSEQVKFVFDSVMDWIHQSRVALAGLL